MTSSEMLSVKGSRAGPGRYGQLFAFEECATLWQTMRNCWREGEGAGYEWGGRVMCGGRRLTGVEFGGSGGSGSGRRMVSRGWVVGMLGCWDVGMLRSGEQDGTGRVPAPYICPSVQVSKRTSDPVASQVYSE